MAAGNSKPVVIAAFVGNKLVAITKFIAAWWTGSSVMLSEAIHSLGGHEQPGSVAVRT